MTFARGPETGFNPQRLPNMGRSMRWAYLVVGVMLVLAVVGALRGIYTDWLWFGEVKYRSVFTSVLSLRIGLFAVGALAFAVFAIANVLLAFRLARGEGFLPVAPAVQQWLRRASYIVAIASIVFLSVLFGIALAQRWDSVLQFMHGGTFGQTDPQFGRDVGFYVFQLPFYHLIQGWAAAMVVVTAIGVIGVYYTGSALRGVPFSVTPQLQRHVAVLGALFMLLMAAGHLLSSYDLVFSNRGAAFGAAYTDVAARLPALRFLAIISLASAALFLISAWAGGIRLMLGAFLLWIALVLVAGEVVPLVVQRFIVEPSEFEREEMYIQRNITATRDAYALNRIDEQALPYKADVPSEVIGRNQETVDNLRLWDWQPLMDTYNQVQFFTQYYEFTDVDIDRYTIDGKYRQVMLAARELFPEKLSQDAQRWVNLKLQYTHGYGAAMSPVNEITTDGRPTFLLQDIPPRGEVPLDRPQIYYGENTRGYVVVKSNTVEFDYPTPSEPKYTAYEGEGGVAINGILTKAAYAWQFGDFNLLISPEITAESRLHYRREIKERVSTVAPFLTLDVDPYVVISEGRLYWIQDAYTATDRYPYSTQVQVGGSNLNYMRNSVKVVVDAYNGTMRFYIADATDPIIAMYAKAFPGLLEPLTNMPADLQSHMRYPEDFFSVQSHLYLRYHMSDPRVFFTKEDLWSIPNETSFDEIQPVQPYYMIMKLPGETKEEFVLILPFAPATRPNLVGWMAARSDAPNYGQLLSFTLPRGQQVDGPSQIEARINNDPLISQQFALWNQAGSKVRRGNLLVVPLEDRVLYVKPIFLQSANLAFPELKRVILATSEKVVMMPSLEEAVTALLGGSPPVVVEPGDGTGDPDTVDAQIDKLADAINAMIKTMGEMQAALEELRKATGGDTP